MHVEESGLIYQPVERIFDFMAVPVNLSCWSEAAVEARDRILQENGPVFTIALKHERLQEAQARNLLMTAKVDHKATTADEMVTRLPRSVLSPLLAAAGVGGARKA